MKKDRILNPTVVAVVALLHIGLMSLLWKAHKPDIVDVTHIEFVELGDLGGGDGAPEGAGAPAPVQAPPQKPKPRPEPKPKPKPVEEAKPVIKPVITKKADADMQQAKEKPKPVEKNKPKPEPKPEPRIEFLPTKPYNNETEII